MQEHVETKFLMQALITRLKTQKAVSQRLGISKQSFNTALNHGKTIPLKLILQMKELLNQLMLEKN